MSEVRGPPPNTEDPTPETLRVTHRAAVGGRSSVIGHRVHTVRPTTGARARICSISAANRLGIRA
jgi:hypothetical protein